MLIVAVCRLMFARKAKREAKRERKRERKRNSLVFDVFFQFRLVPHIEPALTFLLRNRIPVYYMHIYIFMYMYK